MGCNLSPANFPVREKRNCFLQSNNITLCVAMILHRQPNTHRSIDGVKGEWRVTLSFYKSMLRDDNCVHGRIYPLPRGVKRHPFVGKLHRVGFCIGSQMQAQQPTLKHSQKYLNVLGALMVLKKGSGELLLTSINPYSKNKQMHRIFPKGFGGFHFKNSPTSIIW